MRVIAFIEGPDVIKKILKHLDRSIQFQVIELLKQLQSKYDLAYMFISHDLKVVKSLCHEIVIMRHG